MSRTRANLLLLAIALIWGSAFIAQNKGMASIGPLLFTGVRFIIGALVVMPLALTELRRRPSRRVLPREAVAVGGLGLLMFAGAAMQQIGIVSTSVTHAGFLTALYVPLVPLLSWLVLRHLPHWSVWPGALACVVGAWLLSGVNTQGAFALSTGDLWVALSAIPWAFHVLFVGRVADRMHAPFMVAAGQFLVCGVASLLGAALYEPVSMAGLVSAAGPLAYGGVLSVGVAFTAQVVAQRHAHASDAAIILSAETLFAAIFGYALLGDRLTPEGLYGCALILASMVSIQLLPLLRRAPALA